MDHDFLYDLSLSDISSVTTIPDPNIALNYFAKTFNSFAEKHAPFKKLRVKNRSNPWFSPEIAAMLRNRDIVWNRARASGLSNDWQYFCHLRKYVLLQYVLLNHLTMLNPYQTAVVIHQSSGEQSRLSQRAPPHPYPCRSPKTLSLFPTIFSCICET